MGLARLISRGQSGLDAYEVAVEVHVGGGLPAFAITGLPAAAVRESKDRVRAALNTNGWDYPGTRITVHLGPADVPKDGGRFDLAIAVGVIKAHQPQWACTDTELIGELALNGELRPVTGVLPAVLAARHADRRLVIPAANAVEAGLVPNAEVYAARGLNEVVAHIDGRSRLERVAPTVPAEQGEDLPDLSDVRGHATAKRALTVAAAGQHSLLMIGPPGSGKSMLAERLRGLLPKLPSAELLRVASIASVAGTSVAPLLASAPPFRAPHHTISAQALVGGGPRPRPGEISLAHRGVLFLDELPEFPRPALEALREPLETHCVRISRVREQVVFPADFQLIAAMNPCPCGYLGDGTDRCRCSPLRIGRYRGRLSGPLLDRFDMHIDVPQVDFDVLTDRPPAPESPAAAGIVGHARERQLGRQDALNGRLADGAFWAGLTLDGRVRRLLQRAAERWQLSTRSTVRVLKLARTIADLDDTDTIAPAHLGEALQLRCLDRSG